MFFSSFFYTLPLLIILYSPGYSQTLLTGFDQIKISKTSHSELSYLIEHPQVKQARFEIYKPRKEKNDLTYLLKDFNQSMLARVFGYSNSHRDMNFRIPADIHFNENERIWKFNIYAFGDLEKIRKKEQVFENKKLLISDKNVRIDWEVDTWCTLEEEGKKIGGFSIKLNPFRDTNFLKTAYYSIEAKNDQSWVKMKHPFDSLRKLDEFKDPDYGAIGLLDNVPAVFLYYADNKKLWIFLNAEPVSFFNLEYTQVELILENGRNRYVAHQNPPELWIRKNYLEDKKAHIIRLTIFSRLMIWALNHNEFNY